MKILIDMNLSPGWVPVFKRKGWEAVHWSNVGDPKAKDIVLMDWARLHGYIVFTHDLDFGAILAVTHAEGPSVFQVRTQDVTTIHLEKIVINTMSLYQNHFERGVLIVLDEDKMRVRILPLD